MAKRKRLTPANPAFLDPAPETKSALGAPMRAAPIADVAREASASAAAEELARTLTEAREAGRMVITVPLAQIQLDYLVRDRVVVDETEMQALKDSLRSRGQQTPVELVDLGDGHTGRQYGLISGWRRCAALKALAEETGEARFTEVLGLLRQPEDSADAYLAMVEENEIRVGLSYFERARIVAKSVASDVFDSDRAALQALFQSASRAKRSKIGSFLAVVRALDGQLRFPEAVGERLGLQLSRVLSDTPDLAKTLSADLHRAAPQTPEAELKVLEQALAVQTTPAPQSPQETAAEPQADTRPERKINVVTGISLQDGPSGIKLEGNRVDAALRARLIDWLRQQY
ncbi:MAG: ParB/RepB/Spo0J family partition protein [Pelagimonas sp.]|uniref:ParB/RepB/Spo0J family partition protein n=1 Tax=Pelagimonas sp. TaxID=2073170 RepID=UPI003D6A41A8